MAVIILLELLLILISLAFSVNLLSAIAISHKKKSSLEKYIIGKLSLTTRLLRLS